MIKLICILSKLLKGNLDCIEIIYNKKKLIEKNEILLFHLLNGLKNMMLYSYSIFTININDTYYYHLTDGPTSPVKYIEEVTGEDRIQSYQLHHIDEKIHDGFIKSFQLIKIKDIWNYSYESELENDKRGIYSGAVGYYDFCGNLNTCIAIRTFVMKDDKVFFQAGAGIVHDSA